VRENLMLYGARQPGERLWKAWTRTRDVAERERELSTRAESVARRLNLARVLDDPASALSGGQKKLLELGRALMTDPKLVLLDEPIAGVNPTLAGEIGTHLAALRDEGLTFLIIEHHLDVIARLCDPVVVLAEGRHLAQGTFADVAADERVQEAYMGTRAARSA
jgi:ABC-type branched-subunit amino acid transport system ATPase component